MSKSVIILGLHFGHDACITIIKDGRVISHVERERLVKNKHAISIHPLDIKTVLEDSGVKLESIDFVSVTAGQAIELLLLDKSKLNIRYDVNNTLSEILPCAFETQKLSEYVDSQRQLLLIATNKDYSDAARRFSDEDRDNYLQNPDNYILPIICGYSSEVYNSECNTNQKISEYNYDAFLNDNVRHSYHHNIIVNLFGYEIPGCLFTHHMAHAAAAYYLSGKKEAGIITLDGGIDGLYCYAKENKIYPLTPNHLIVGSFYGKISEADLNIDPGKMMGLAPYGEPILYKDRQVTEVMNFAGSCPVKYQKVIEFNNKLLDDYVNQSCELGIDINTLGNKTQILSTINVNIAASTQKLAENTIIQGVQNLYKVLKNMSKQTDNLCAAGGVFLNCPSNTRILKETNFKNLFIPPMVNDSGLSLGSALALYHNILDYPLNNDFVPSQSDAYLGMKRSYSDESIKLACDKYKDSISIQYLGDKAAKKAAKDLDKDRVIAIFYERSEAGPRALGHRSILANPSKKHNWERVNKIKSRELWRPFAPACIEEDVGEYFKNDIKSDSLWYMLLNLEVTDQNLPAITHVDQTARVQSVNKDAGILYEILCNFKKICGLSVVMNTSFNGKAQPIVERPEEAIELLINTDLDALYLMNYRIKKNTIKSSSKCLKKKTKAYEKYFCNSV
jgi:carbamoyltransferase